MRRTPFASAAIAVLALASGIVSCGDPSTRGPLAPSVPTISGIEIIGPSSIAPGATAEFMVRARLSDGAFKIVTAASGLRWRSSSSLVRVDAAGVATAASDRGAAILTAEITVPPNSLRRASREVMVLPDGTFRVAGRVTEVEFPTVGVANARVEAHPDALTATTNAAGQYVLYGVSPNATLRISADGFVATERQLQLTTHGTENFQLALSGARLRLEGEYVLTVEAPGGNCGSSRPLAADLRRRSYLATLLQSGPNVVVILSESRFRLNSTQRGNRFSGRVDATSAQFTLESYLWYYYWYYGPFGYPNVAEVLPANNVLVVEGLARMSGTSAALSGTLQGGLSEWDPRFPTTASQIGQCVGNIGLTLTRR